MGHDRDSDHPPPHLSDANDRNGRLERPLPWIAMGLPHGGYGSILNVDHTHVHTRHIFEDPDKDAHVCQLTKRYLHDDRRAPGDYILGNTSPQTSEAPGLCRPSGHHILVASN